MHLAPDKWGVWSCSQSQTSKHVWSCMSLASQCESLFSTLTKYVFPVIWQRYPCLRRLNWIKITSEYMRSSYAQPTNVKSNFWSSVSQAICHKRTMCLQNFIPFPNKFKTLISFFSVKYNGVVWFCKDLWWLLSPRAGHRHCPRTDGDFCHRGRDTDIAQGLMVTSVTEGGTQTLPKDWWWLLSPRSGHRHCPRN
jgi:hypothetical protein